MKNLLRTLGTTLLLGLGLFLLGLWLSDMAGGAVSLTPPQVPGVALLQGWLLSSPHSEYESPAHYLSIASAGNQNVTDESTGDGYLKFSSNLNRSNSMWFDWRGQIYVANTNNYNFKQKIFGNNIASAGGTPSAFTTWIGGSTGCVAQVGVASTYVWGSWSNAENSTLSSVTNFGLTPQYHYSTNNGSTDLYYVLGGITSAAFPTGTVFTNGNIRLVPFYAGAGGMLNSLMLQVITPVVGGSLAFGIYNTISPTNLFPNALLFDSGPRDASAANVIITNLAAPIHLNPGQIYYHAVRANTNIALTCLNNTTLNNILGITTNFLNVVSIEAVSVDLLTNLPPVVPLTSYILHGPSSFNTVVAGRISGP